MNNISGDRIEGGDLKWVRAIYRVLPRVVPEHEQVARALLHYVNLSEDNKQWRKSWRAYHLATNLGNNEFL